MSLLWACLAGACLVAPGAVAQQAGATSARAPLNTLTPEERAAGWKLLFDGHSTLGWRGWKMDTIPSGWGAREGAPTRVRPPADIIPTEKSKKFQPWLEWNLAPGGNTRIFYRPCDVP